MTTLAATLTRTGAALDAALPGVVERSSSLGDLTTYRVGGPAALLVRVGDESALDAVAAVVAAECPPVLVVGRGSNLLIADAGFRGLAIVLAGAFEDVVLRADDGLIEGGAAAALPVVARRAAAAGLAGVEFLVGIPGSVGGAVRMNAGGHGRETREVLGRAWIRELGDGADGVSAPRDVTELGLSYRHSNLGPRAVVTRAEFRVVRDDPEACEARVAEIVRWRRDHQPGGSNAGSVFRNPPGDAAGRLIEAAGCKGLRVGAAVVSEKHANFVQAEPGATAADVRRLVAEVASRVRAATGVTLETELRFVGFEPPDGMDDGLDVARGVTNQ
jgi:UDP-N-acetylmuramate dehydrogenase